MNTSALHDLWVQLTATPLFGLTLTILSYSIGRAIQRACRGATLANPVLISILLTGGVLGITGIPYKTYFVSAQLIHFLLGPATVALAVPLVRNLADLRRDLPGIALALTAGSLVSAVGGIALVEICGGSRATALSMAPKAVTTPIAIEVTQTVGGIPSLTAVLAIASGVLVAISIQSLLRRAKITDWRAFGLAAGTVGSGVGAAHAISLNERAGAFAALAIGLNGLLTTLTVPMLVHFWPYFKI
jgi:putative effector of murein hydrolase